MSTVTTVLETVKAQVQRCTGWTDLSVYLKEGVLHVETKSQQLLVLDVASGREIYGRMRNMGITVALLADIRGVL